MTATKEATETWLDAMPAIPDALEPGCPVVLPDQGWAGWPTRRAIVVMNVEGGIEVVTPHRREYADASHVRIDLDDPIGFSVALRWLWSNEDAWVKDPVLRHWLRGETTDVDRVVLAKACAEVMLCAEDG